MNNSKEYNKAICEKAYNIMLEAIENQQAILKPVGCGGNVYKYTQGEYRLSLTKHFDVMNCIRQHKPILTIFKGAQYTKDNVTSFNVVDMHSNNVQLVEDFVFYSTLHNNKQKGIFTHIKNFFYEAKNN